MTSTDLLEDVVCVVMVLVTPVADDASAVTVIPTVFAVLLVVAVSPAGGGVAVVAAINLVLSCDPNRMCVNN